MILRLLFSLADVGGSVAMAHIPNTFLELLLSLSHKFLSMSTVCNVSLPESKYVEHDFKSEMAVCLCLRHCNGISEFLLLFD